jgi:hypothetical protein
MQTNKRTTPIHQQHISTRQTCLERLAATHVTERHAGKKERKKSGNTVFYVEYDFNNVEQ